MTQNELDEAGVVPFSKWQSVATKNVLVINNRIFDILSGECVELKIIDLKNEKLDSLNPSDFMRWITNKNLIRYQK